LSIVSYALSGNKKRFNQNLKEIAKREDCSVLALKMKFYKCFLTQGFGFSDYLNYELYKKSKKEIKEYVSIKDQDKFYEIVSPARYKTFFTIKPNFLNNFKKYVNRDFFYQDTLKELEKFLKKHEYFMKKPVDGLGGHGVEKVYTKDIKNVKDFYQELIDNNLFLEEYVMQHDKLNEICSSNVNTMRIMTFRYDDVVEIIFAALRVGNGEADVDNFHQGGMGILIDIETGKLVGNAYNKDLKEFKKHPKSNIKFDGLQLPNWEIVKKTVTEAAKVNDHIHVVGWDVAITNKGCVLIEGNRRPGFDMVQVLYKRGRKDMMRHCLEIMNEKENQHYKI